VALAVRYEITRLAEECLHRASAILGELSPDEIERLDAVRAFIDHRDPRIAHELLHPPFRDIAVTAEHLLGFDGVGEARVGEHALQYRRQQAETIVRRLPNLWVGEFMRLVQRQRR